MTESSSHQNRFPYAAAIGAMVTIIILTSLIVATDLLPDLKTWLKTTFTHHWVGKGAIGAIVFLVTGVVMTFGKPKTDDQLVSATKKLFITSLAGLFILTAFFFYEAFVKK